MPINAIKAFNDNYIWCMQYRDQAVVVDPGDPAPVLQYLQQNNLTLSAILITHHHHDHTGGVAELLKHFPVTVYAPANGNYDFKHHPVAEGDCLELTEVGCELTVMEVPGHTIDHVAYYNHDILFCGDTLFAGGCGRIFEGTPEMMYQSLMRLAALPAETKVYCAHEYTLSNLHFAQSVDPDNAELMQRIEIEAAKRERDEPTVPSTIGLELKTNPFLSLPLQDSDPVQRFAELRALKDRF